MKKSVLAVCLAALPVAAVADVTLYGQVKSGITGGQVKIKGAQGTEKSATSVSIHDNGSHIGFKGSENLGDGLKAVWQVEQKTAISGESQKFATRDSFIGLEGGFGKVRAGHLSSVLNEMDTIDTWLYKNNAAGLGIFTRTGERKVAVRYDSPAFSGFKVTASYSPRDNFDAEDKYKHEKPSKERYTVGASYSNAGFTTNVAYGHYKGAYSQNGASKPAQIAKVESYYNGNNLFVGAGVQYAKGFETANKYLSYFTDGFNTYKGTDITKDAEKNEAVKVVDAAVTLGYKMGNVVPRVSYAHGWAAKGVGTGATYVDKFDQIVVGGDYNFSKRTGLRAQVAHLRVGGNTRFAENQKGKVERTAATLGMIHKF